jgi:competence protein ComEA
MFRGAILNTQPIETDPTSDRRGSLVPWSWPTGARLLLAASAMAVALGLTSASRDVRTSSEPIARPPELVLDPNTAPLHALVALPHIGPALANRLEEARKERPFTSLDDLKDRVRGVGPVTLAQITPYLQIQVAPGSKLETLIASQGGQSARKSKSTRRKTIRSTEPIADPPRLAAIEVSSHPQRITSPAR